MAQQLEASPTPPDANVLAQERTNLASERTRIAAERTLMAWIRTALSMVSFGFSIYKFFQYMRESEGLHGQLAARGPRNLGLTLIGLGTVALIAACWQHWQFLDRLGLSPLSPPRSLALLIAVLVACIGAVAFYGVLLGTGPF